MAVIASSAKVHWNYFLALERDIEVAARYVELSSANMSTYSIEFAHLLFAAASEVDVVAKLLCRVLAPSLPCHNIEHYRGIMSDEIPDLAATQVLVPRYGLTLTPWQNWEGGTNPDWWRSYNNVKHKRDVHYSEATLKNALNSLAGLMILSFYHYSFPGLGVGRAVDKKETTRYLLPESSLMRFPDSFYYRNLIVD